MILYHGRYYIFASMTLGVWVSDDLAHWENHRLPDNLTLYDYAPDVRVVEVRLPYVQNSCVSDIVVFLNPYFMPLMFLIAGISAMPALQKRTTGACKAEQYKWISLCISLTASVCNVYLFIWSDSQHALPNMAAKYVSEWFMVNSLIGIGKRYLDFRACLKNHSHHLHAPFCVIFAPDSVAVARYDSFIWHKSPTNCDAHLTESIFQTRSSGKVPKYMSQRSYTFYIFHFIWLVLFQYLSFV